METTKTAEAPESATETEIDAKAVEVATEEDAPAASMDGNENENENEARNEARNEIEAVTEAEDDLDDELESAFDEPAAQGSGSGVVAGTAAVIGAGLALSSLTGTWIADLMAERQNIIAQAAGTATTTNQQIAQLYGTPWHTTALFNGFFAIAAVLVSVAVLLTAKGSATWVRALAFGALAIGVLGLFIAGVMWFDVFTDIPTVAATTTASTG